MPLNSPKETAWRTPLIIEKRELGKGGGQITLQIKTELKTSFPLVTVVLFLNAVVPNQSLLNSFLKAGNFNVTDSVMQNTVSKAPASCNKKQ